MSESDYPGISRSKSGYGRQAGRPRQGVVFSDASDEMQLEERNFHAFSAAV